MSIHAAKELLNGSGIGLGAQNMHWEHPGAYTGEYPRRWLKNSASMSIIGIRRRTYFAETGTATSKKSMAALANDRIPIVCVGLTLEENKAGKTR
jgi:triosephosphate isomerase